MTKIEDDIVENHRHGIMNRRKQNQVDVLFSDLNNYRHNID